MRRSILVLGFTVATAAGLSAQNASQTAPYQGVSHPPSDDTIVTTTIPEPKPQAGQPMPAADTQQLAPPAAQMNVQVMPQPSSVDPSANFAAPQGNDGTDGGIVRMTPSSTPPQPGLNERTYANDPDGDIVHPHPLRPGELQQGTTIRVHLLGRLSTAETERGEPFRTRVATDVMQDGQILIPAGAEIDGRVVEVSSGHAGGHGTMRLQPEFVTLPNGSRYMLHAAVTATPGSKTHVVGEGIIRPNSRAKRDGIEYGGAVGSGVVVGAIVGGPAGALTGGLIGAGVVTVHLLVSHPQATLEDGTTLVFQLTDRLYMAPDAVSGN
jgi:hypothetical protein